MIMKVLTLLRDKMRYLLDLIALLLDKDNFRFSQEEPETLPTNRV
jgi:hypothetical protein